MFEFLSKRIDRPKPQTGFFERIRDFGAGAIQAVRDEVRSSSLLSGIFGDSRSKLIREPKIAQVRKDACSRPAVSGKALAKRGIPGSLPAVASRTRPMPSQHLRTKVNIDEPPLALTKSQFRLDQHLIPVRHGGTSMSDRFRYTPTSRQIQKVESFRDRISQMAIQGDEGEIAVTKEGEFLSHSIVERFLSTRRTKLNCRVSDSITHMSLDFLLELDRKLSDFFRACDITLFAENFPGGLVCCNSSQTARSPAFFTFDIHKTAAENLAAYRDHIVPASDEYEVEITDIDEGGLDGMAGEFLTFDDDEITKILPRDEALQLLVKKFPREISFEMDPSLDEISEDQLEYLCMFLKKYPPSFFTALGFMKIRLTANPPLATLESQLSSSTFVWDVNDCGVAGERQLLKIACACESPTQFTWARERRSADKSVLDRRLAITLDQGLSMSDPAILERFLQLSGEFSCLPDWIREIVFTDDPAVRAIQKIPLMSHIPDAADLENVRFLPDPHGHKKIIIDINASPAQVRQQFLDMVRREDERKQQLDDLNRGKKITPLHIVDRHDTDVDALRPAAMAEPILRAHKFTRMRVGVVSGAVAAGALAGAILRYQPNGFVSAQPIPPPPVVLRPDVGSELFSGPVIVDEDVTSELKSVPKIPAPQNRSAAPSAAPWPHVRKIDGKEIWRGGDMKLKAQGYGQLAKIYAKRMSLQQNLPLQKSVQSIFEEPHPETGKHDTLFPKLKKFGMNDATAAHVLAVLVKHGVDVDDFRPGDKVSFDPNGNIITVIQKNPKGGADRVFMRNNMLDPSGLR